MMNCPECASRAVWKKSGNAQLAFPLKLFMVCVRCHNCGRTFRRFGLLPGNSLPEERRVAA